MAPGSRSEIKVGGAGEPCGGGGGGGVGGVGLGGGGGGGGVGDAKNSRLVTLGSGGVREGDCRICHDRGGGRGKRISWGGGGGGEWGWTDDKSQVVQVTRHRLKTGWLAPRRVYVSESESVPALGGNKEKRGKIKKNTSQWPG